ncbi:hypothetical protein TNCV_4005841 [Trichonephila clavipes]|nr:hypothetical protein TNCV_4005841 [Trichonephila clavipes]
MRTTHELAPPSPNYSTNGRAFKLSTDLTCIASLHGRSLVVPEIVEALSTSPPTNKSILTDDEDDSVVILLAKRLKHYNPPAIHVMAFILAIPG